MVENLLSEIYTQYHIHSHLDSSTETSCFSDGLHVNHYHTNLTSMVAKERFQTSNLQTHQLIDLYEMKEELEQRVVVVSAKLVRQLKQRSRLKDKNLKHCDTITAVLQAVSQKRWVDTQLRFTLDPLPGSPGFKQWSDALRAIIQLPGGLPSCWRKRVWTSIAQNHFDTKHPDLKWLTIKSWVFSDRVCSTDETLGNQIVKDLHRTGYSNILSSTSEEEKIEDRLLLKRVLLAYARWNKEIGYCQGFNVIAALLLQVTEGDDEAAFKIMVYLVDKVLPENYFSNNLQALSVDMAVFRDLLKIRLPNLSQLLDQLQKEANDTGTCSYEPPLTNVFTMQWFLTLFATFLPINTVLRVWDSLIVDGNEVLIRVALAVWTKLNEKVSKAQSADEFYSIMSCQMQDAAGGKLAKDDELISIIYKLAPFPFPRLDELREKYTYNITPFLPTIQQSDETVASPMSDVDVSTFSCFTGFMGQGARASSSPSSSQQSKSRFSPAASHMMSDRMNTDIASLKQQYLAIQARQANAHLICTNPVTRNQPDNGGMISYFPNRKQGMVNHLMIGQDSNFNPNLVLASTTTTTVPIQFQQSQRHPSKKKKQRY